MNKIDNIRKSPKLIEKLPGGSVEVVVEVIVVVVEVNIVVFVVVVSKIVRSAIDVFQKCSSLIDSKNVHT